MMPLVQAAADTPYSFNINSIIGGFCLVCALFILREFRRQYDWFKENQTLPATTRRIALAIFGGVDESGKLHVGLLEQLRTLAKKIEDHCNDERQFWDEVRDGREAIADRAQEAVSVSEERLREQFDTLNKKVDVLTERRVYNRERPT